MKILIIENSVAFTGAFKCGVSEAELLSGEHEFIFLISTKSNLEIFLKNKGFKVYKLPLKEISKSINAIAIYPFFFLKNLAALKKIVRQENVAVVQVNDFYNLLGAALKWSGYAGKLITYVRFLPEVIPAVLRKIWITAAQKYSHKVIAVSDAVLQQLPKSANTVRIYDPVNLKEKYQNIHRTGEIINLLYIANFTKGKGQEHAVKAFYQAYSKNKNLRLQFFGGTMGQEKNEHFKKELIISIKELKLNDVVCFDVFKEDVEKEMKQGDIILNFSEAESFSMTCLEAACYGTSLIATKCGGPEEIIKHNETGLLVEKGNIASMSQAILLLAGDSEKRKSFAEAGRKYVREKFSVENFKKTFSAILIDG